MPRAHSARRLVLGFVVAAGLVAGGCSGSSPAGPSPIADPLPVPPVTGEAHLVGAGDIGDCLGGPARTAALLDRLDGVVFTAGDSAQDSGSAEDFRRCFEPTWGRHRARIRPSPGNHDVQADGGAGYFGYFGAAAAPPTGYYSYDLGAWHVVVLNSNTPIDRHSPQMGWLRADLAATASRCTLAVWHHPRFSSGEHGSDARLGDLWRVLHEHGVDVVVNGHDHLYERFARQDPDGGPDAARGIRQFTVGTGGARLRGVAQVERNSEVRQAVWGVIRFALRGADYSWEFVPVDGESFRDAGSDTCS